MVDFHDVYARDADRYHRMVEAEDVDKRVIASLEALCALDGARVVEVGVGTGRIACQLVAKGADVVGIEPAPAMLAVAKERFEELARDPNKLEAGTFDRLPYADDSADLVVAGWVLGHQRAWNPDGFCEAVRGGVLEMLRVVRPGGAVAIFETLGTGAEQPRHHPELEEVFAIFESELGFERRVLRTDYGFESVEEACDKMGFFFGESLIASIRENGWSRVPECTGLWTRSKTEPRP